MQLPVVVAASGTLLPTGVASSRVLPQRCSERCTESGRVVEDERCQRRVLLQVDPRCSVLLLEAVQRSALFQVDAGGDTVLPQRLTRHYTLLQNSAAVRRVRACFCLNSIVSIIFY